MFKKVFAILISTTVACVQLPSGGSSSKSRQASTPIALSEKNVRAAALTDTLLRSPISSALRPGQPSTSFGPRDEVYFMVVLTWENPEMRHRFTPVIKWFANGSPHSRYSPGEVSVGSPYQIWASQTAFSLGTGTHVVELWSDDRRLARSEFQVTNEDVLP